MDNCSLSLPFAAEAAVTLNHSMTGSSFIATIDVATCPSRSSLQASDRGSQRCLLEMARILTVVTIAKCDSAFWPSL